VDLIESGPEPPARAGWAAAVRTRVRGRVVRPGRAGRGQRLATVAATGLLSIGLLAGLRAGLAEPAGTATFTAVSLPPYDTLPGRTRVPTPVQGSEDGQVVTGDLPMLSGLDPGVAETAARLVLGRYCRHPDRLGVTAGQAGRYSAPVSVVDAEDHSRPVATIIVYASRTDPSRVFWRGWLHQLHRCP
jgi:hypothetical protein